ncbi:MAG TPA: DUF2142 domain-containing protein [Conexibacter sp.]
MQPPAYYLLAAPFYHLGDGASLPVRLLLVRMLSVILAAVATACAYLFVRELIPGSRWPARAGALALALQPIFMFNESGVNSDALVVAVAAAVALVVARAWRRGLTTSHALALGALTGVGVLSKVNFLLLLPSIALAVCALWWGAGAGARRAAALRLAGAAAVALALLGLYVLVDDVAWHRTTTFRQAAYSVQGGGVGRLLSHVWQFFLPALPSMQLRLTNGGAPPVWDELVKGSTSRLGWWNDYGLPSGWATLALLLVALVALGAARWLLPRVRRRPGPPLVAAGCALAFLGALVVADYQYGLGTGASGIEGRYIFPLAPLWAVTVGACVAGVPARRRPLVTGVLASAFVLYTVVALATTVQRYYL